MVGSHLRHGGFSSCILGMEALAWTRRLGVGLLGMERSASCNLPVHLL